MNCVNGLLDKDHAEMFFDLTKDMPKGPVTVAEERRVKRSAELQGMLDKIDMKAIVKAAKGPGKWSK